MNDIRTVQYYLRAILEANTGAKVQPTTCKKNILAHKIFSTGMVSGKSASTVLYVYFNIQGMQFLPRS